MNASFRTIYLMSHYLFLLCFFFFFYYFELASLCMYLLRSTF